MAAGSTLTARRHLDLGRLASALCTVARARS
ncbi:MULTISPECIES: putative leader peptide [Streptomyces]